MAVTCIVPALLIGAINCAIPATNDPTIIVTAWQQNVAMSDDQQPAQAQPVQYDPVDTMTRTGDLPLIWGECADGDFSEENPGRDAATFCTGATERMAEETFTPTPDPDRPRNVPGIKDYTPEVLDYFREYFRTHPQYAQMFGWQEHRPHGIFQQFETLLTNPDTSAVPLEATFLAGTPPFTLGLGQAVITGAAGEVFRRIVNRDHPELGEQPVIDITSDRYRGRREHFREIAGRCFVATDNLHVPAGQTPVRDESLTLGNCYEAGQAVAAFALAAVR